MTAVQIEAALCRATVAHILLTGGAGSDNSADMDDADPWEYKVPDTHLYADWWALLHRARHSGAEIRVIFTEGQWIMHHKPASGVTTTMFAPTLPICSTRMLDRLHEIDDDFPGLVGLLPILTADGVVVVDAETSVAIRAQGLADLIEAEADAAVHGEVSPTSMYFSLDHGGHLTSFNLCNLLQLGVNGWRDVVNPGPLPTSPGHYVTIFRSGNGHVICFGATPREAWMGAFDYALRHP